MTPRMTKTLDWLDSHPGWHSVIELAEAVGAAPSGIGRTVGALGPFVVVDRGGVRSTLYASRRWYDHATANQRQGLR